MPVIIPIQKAIRYLQIPPLRLTATKTVFNDVYLFDFKNGTAYSDRISELLTSLEQLYYPVSPQPVGTPGLLGLHQHGVKSFSDGDFKIEYKDEVGLSDKELEIASAKSEIWGILADFGFVVQAQGVLERS